MCCVSASVLPLDWTSPPSLAQLFQSLQPARAGATAAKRPQVDVIFAADCTYSEDISEHLVRTLETLLCPPRELGDGDGDGDRDGDREVDGDAHQPLAIVASTIRNEDTFKHFLSVLQASAVLAYEDVTDWASRVAVPVASFYIPNKESIKIIKIRRCC